MEEYQQELNKVDRWYMYVKTGFACVLLGAIAISLMGIYKVLLLIVMVMIVYGVFKQLFAYHQCGVVSNDEVNLWIILGLIDALVLGEFLMNANLY